MNAFADDIRDIKPPVSFPANHALLSILAGVIFLAAVFALTVFIVKKIKERKGLFKKPPKTAHQIAREALERLKADNLPGAGKVKEYYFELSDIVRRYIEQRFSIKAPEMTTEEFLFSLRESEALSGVHKNLLKEFLSLCDIVKFARYGPTVKEIDDSFAAAKKFVDDTKPAEENLKEAPEK